MRAEFLVTPFQPIGDRERLNRFQMLEKVLLHAFGGGLQVGVGAAKWFRNDFVHEFEFEARDLGAVREFVRHAAEGAGLELIRVEDLIIAVSELAANSVRHGGGTGSLRVWREPAAIVCEVRDAGLIDEPLVGRIKPSHEQIGGRGLWIVNYLCDLVELRSSDEGTVVRVRMDLG